ncbi:MAG: TlyA family RNA methyltransferase [Nitrospirae bacterium]|nr:TlyA family RNA methyltransferase [Nitrospirota bacterium]
MTPVTRKIRLDQLLVSRGLAESHAHALALIMAGQVRVDGEVVSKAGTPVAADAQVTRGPRQPFVSRGGQKLAGALDAFGIDATGVVALDAGASTGGFTDCLLQKGAAHVFAADVGHGQLDTRIAGDPRVTVMDRTNVRHLTPANLPQAMDMVVGDLSFISLALVLPALAALVRPGGTLVLLVKPQFEVDRRNVGKGGIVRDPDTRDAAVDSVIAAARGCGLEFLGRATSPITGAKGNVEFLIHLRRPADTNKGDTP